MCGDIKSRPDLTPRLGGLYFEPAFAAVVTTLLVRLVKDSAYAVLAPILWLYTRNA